MESNDDDANVDLQAPHTYVAGEDADRLASTAKSFGLAKARQPLKPWQNVLNVLFSDSTLPAARMHSVGYLGDDETVDNSGTIHHQVTIKRYRRTLGSTKPLREQLPESKEYGELSSLFQRQEPEPLELEKDEEEEEEVTEDIVEGGSLGAAIFGIVKGTVGPAILFLPRGFQNSGYAIAIPSMVFATLTFIYSSFRLLECWKVERERNFKLEEIKALLTTSYGTGDGATAKPPEGKGATSSRLLTYPELARRAFGSYAFLVELGIALLRVCLTYFIFVPQNLYECTRSLFGLTLPKEFFLLLTLLIEIPLSWIRDIRKLAPTNILATLLIVFGLLSILGIAFRSGLRTDNNTGELVFRTGAATLPALTESWFLFVGTSFYMMEGAITLLVPLQEAVYREEDKAKFPRINATVTSWIVVFYVIFSIICCAAFGDRVRTTLSASLPEGALATAVQLAYSIAVIFTFPLQAFPAQEVACRAFGVKQQKTPGKSSLRRNALVTTLTILLAVIAVVAIDYLGNVVSILGALFGIPLALVFPPIMHNILVKESYFGTRLMNYCVVLVGFFAMGAASYATVKNWDKGVE